MGNNNYKKRHLEQGLCTLDSNVAVAGKTRCLKCMERDREYAKIQRRKIRIYRKEHRLCTHCGAPLEEHENITCYNCGGSQRKVMVYAKNR